MRVIRREVLNALREQYPAGTRVELVQMDDPQAPPIGTLGTVRGVDDIGSIMVRWDNGSGLSVAYGEDVCRKVPVMSETVRDQILAIRATGLANMFDIPLVQNLANDRGYCELVVFLEEHRAEYARFILTGDA
jgi:hypothetical protein